MVILFFLLMIAVSGSFFVYLAFYSSRKYQCLSLISTAIENDMPLPDLLAAHAQSHWGKRKQQMLDLADMLREGTPLPIALENFKRLIPTAGQLAVRVGGETGTLKECLTAASETYLRRPFLKGYGLYSLNLYLSLLLLAVAIVSAFIIYFITPKFEEIFSGFGIDLPYVFLLHHSISSHLIDYFYFYIPLALFCVFYLYNNLYPTRDPLFYFNQHKYLRIIFAFFLAPIIYIENRLSLTYKKWATPELLSYLEVASRARLPLGLFVESLANHHSAPEIRVLLSQVTRKIQQGNDLWMELQRSRMISSHQAKSLQAAETLGQLPNALHFQQHYLQTDSTYRTERRLEIFRFILVLLLATWIGLLALAYFVPIIQLIHTYDYVSP